MKALLKNYRQQPRKVRLLADMVRGKEVKKAIAILQFADKRAAEPFAKVIRSAVANAVVLGKKADNLYIKSVTVNKGVTAMRFRARARGSAAPIRRSTSHIAVELAERS